MTSPGPLLALRDVTRVHGEGARRVTALDAVSLHDLTRLRRHADDFVGQLVLDHHLFLTEAELRWLDHIEGTLGRRAEVRSDAGAAIMAEPSPVSNAKGRR